VYGCTMWPNLDCRVWTIPDDLPGLDPDGRLTVA
jgi:hypothetical protein